LGSKRLRPPRKIQRKCPITVNVLPQKKKSSALSESEVHWYLMFLGGRERERIKERESERESDRTNMKKSVFLQQT
jgi:hypothetical protein